MLRRKHGKHVLHSNELTIEVVTSEQMMSLGCYWNVVLLHMLFIIGKHTAYSSIC